jgi:hypothetical protein
VRSVKGFFESPNFAACGRKYIKIFNTWQGAPGAAVIKPGFNLGHVAFYEE